MTTDREGLAEEIARVLGEHDGWGNNGKSATECRWMCNCGEVLDDDFSGVNVIARQRAHLADALADLLAARDRRVRGEAWDEAVASAYLHETEHWEGIAHDPNPYREADE